MKVSCQIYPATSGKGLRVWVLVFLHPVNLIRGMVKGEDFVRPVQAFMLLEMFPETFL